MDNKGNDLDDSDFDNIKLVEASDGSTADIDEEQGDDGKLRRKKMKRKKVYFRSDFVNDESSSDEEEIVTKNTFAIQDKNPSDLSWGMWLWYYTVTVSVGTFHAAEYCGEKLADLFGITAPKYQYAINEYHRLRQEEREEEEAEEREREHVQKKQFEKLNQLEVGISNELNDQLSENPIS